MSDYSGAFRNCGVMLAFAFALLTAVAGQPTASANALPAADPSAQEIDASDSAVEHDMSAAAQRIWEVDASEARERLDRQYQLLEVN